MCIRESEPSEIYTSVPTDGLEETSSYSPDGGMDIEEVAEKNPERIFKEEIDPGGHSGVSGTQVAFNLGLSGKAFKK